MLGVKSVVFPVCAAICLLALFHKLRDVRRYRRDPSLLALLVAFSCKAISFTLSTPSVAATVDRWTDIPNLGALGIHVLGGVASSAAVLVAIAYWVYPPDEARRRAVRRLVSAALCAAVMLTMWWSAASAGEERAAHYLLQQASRPAITVYLLVYVTAFGSGMVETIRVCARFSRVAGRQWLRRGLCFTGIGAGTYLVYCVDRATAVIAVHLGLEPLDWEVLTPLANGVGILFLVIGLTMPSWGPTVTDWCYRARNFRTFQKLHPLWRALRVAHPHIALEPRHAGPLARFMPGHINYRLYRQVVEIQDGLLALRPRMDPAVIEEARRSAVQAGMSGQALHATVQATVLNHALGAENADRGAAEGPVAVEPFPAGGGDYTTEVARLLEVAKAYARLQPRRKRPS